ncbi:MAG: SDR family NAD(P)-dependent oxidoreductase [Pseudomonadales bacterium]
MTTLIDKTVLVTGGAQGIGKGLARAVLKAGARAVIVNQDEAIAAASVAELSELGPIRSRRCDVSERAQIDALLDDIWATEGPVDLIFCNAGYGGSAPLLDVPMADVERMFAVNYFSMLHLTQSYVPRVKQAGASGHIMFTGSENSLVMPDYIGEMDMGIYAATKHAMLVTAEWLRHELRDTGVGVSVLLPGPVKTERLAATFEAMAATPAADWALPEAPARAIAERFITPDECAAIALQGWREGLFYIPAHGYIREDLERRREELQQAFTTLGL